MLRTFRYRLYPNQVQRTLIRKTADACRFVYNWALETKKKAYEIDGTNLSWYDLNNRLKELKAHHPWLKYAYPQALQQAIKRLNLAFQHFFRRIRQGEKKPGYPKYKRRKSNRQSFDVPQFFTFDFATRRTHLPKIGQIKTAFHRRFTGIPKTCTVVSTNTDKFFLCIVVEDGKTPPPKPHVTQKNSVGIDVGLKTYATFSTGETIGNPRYLQNALKRLQCLYRRLSKKKKDSKNWENARQSLARCHEHITNQRLDFQHKLSTRLIRENQAIIVESLNVHGMVNNHRMGQVISDAAWSRFLRMLKYKAEQYGVTLFEVGRFEPISRLCHICGNKNDELKLSDREWTCPACGTQHDRDLNAAQNIKLMGLRSLKTPREPRKEPVELLAMAEAMKQETPPLRAG